MAAPPPQPPQAELAATNIVFPGRANEDDSLVRAPSAAPVVDTKDVREQGREKLDNWGNNSERGITDILHSVTNDGKRGCLCTPLTFVDKYSRINGDCRTTFRGHKWCYITEESDCRDAQRSRKFPILKWSHSACQLEFAPPVEVDPPKQPLQPPKQPLQPLNPPRDFPKIIRPRGSFPSQDGRTDDVKEGGKEKLTDEEVIFHDAVTASPIRTREERQP